MTVIDRVSRALSPWLTSSSPLTTTNPPVPYPLLTEFTLWSYITPSASSPPAPTKPDIHGSSRPPEVTNTTTATTTSSSSSSRIPQVPSDPSPYTKITDLKAPKPSPSSQSNTSSTMDKVTLEHSFAYLMQCNNSLIDRILTLLSSSSLQLHGTHHHTSTANNTTTTSSITELLDKRVSLDRLMQLSSTPQSSIALLHLIYSLLRHILIHHYNILTHNWNTTTSIFMEHIHHNNLYIARAENATVAGSTEVSTTTTSTMPWHYISVQYTWIETCLRKRREMCDMTTAYPPLTAEEVKLREVVNTHLS